MGYIPKAIPVRCPGCLSLSLTPVFRHWFSNQLRLECKCGVAGRWVTYDGTADAFNAACEGWAAVFGHRVVTPPSGGSAGERRSRIYCESCPDHPLPPRDFGGGVRL